MSDLVVGGVNQNIDNIAVNSRQNISGNTNSSVPYYHGNLDYPPDTVQFKGQEIQEKRALSKGAKWGIGTVVALATGIGIYLLTRGKVGSKQVQQLAEHVDFQPAKTVQEAKLFAKEKLGVHIDCDLPVDVLNYTNEGLCQLRNKAPKDFNIKWIESNPIAGGYDAEALAQAILKDNKYGIINLSSNYIKNLDKTLSDFIGGELERHALVNINGKLQYNKFFSKADISTEISELINKFKSNPTELSFKDKVKLHLGMSDIGEYMDRLYIQHNGDVSKLAENVKIISNPFHPIFHEQKHILHRIKVKDKFTLLDNIEILKQKGLDTSIYEEFITKYKDIAAKVSEYATTSPSEFVAEVYAKLLSGAKFDNEVMSLYAKYGG